MKLKIIGFCGSAGAGKTECAKALQKRYSRAITLSFADPIKKMAIKEFGWDGNKDDKGRILLQRLGTECGRAYNPDLWVERLAQKIEEIEAWRNPSIDRLYVIDDVRFSNEAEFIKSKGGYIVRIYRPLKANSDHLSERGLPDWLIDGIIYNNRGIDELHEAAIKEAEALYEDD